MKVTLCFKTPGEDVTLEFDKDALLKDVIECIKRGYTLSYISQIYINNRKFSSIVGGDSTDEQTR